jgi:hypothetical protein
MDFEIRGQRPAAGCEEVDPGTITEPARSGAMGNIHLALGKAETSCSTGSLGLFCASATRTHR